MSCGSQQTAKAVMAPSSSPKKGNDKPSCSRAGLRRALMQRKDSLRTIEHCFLEEVCANGDELDILACHKSLLDNTLFPDVSEYSEQQDTASDAVAHNNKSETLLPDLSEYQQQRQADSGSKDAEQKQDNEAAADHHPVLENTDTFTSVDSTTMLGSERRQSLIKERRENPCKIWEAHSSGLGLTRAASRRSLLGRRSSSRQLLMMDRSGSSGNGSGGDPGRRSPRSAFRQRRGSIGQRRGSIDSMSSGGSHTDMIMAQLNSGGVGAKSPRSANVICDPNRLSPLLASRSLGLHQLAEEDEDSGDGKKDELMLPPKVRPLMTRDASRYDYSGEGYEIACLSTNSEEIRDDTEEELRSTRNDWIAKQKQPHKELSKTPPRTSQPRKLQRPVFLREASVNFYSGEGTEVADFQTELDQKFEKSYSDDDDIVADLDRRSKSFDETMSYDRLGRHFAEHIQPTLSDDPLLHHKEASADFIWSISEYHHYDTWLIEEEENFQPPFLILGTSARDVDAHPHVLSPPLMESVQKHLPYSKQGESFWLKYSLVRDGASMWSFLQQARGSQSTVLAIETTDGEVFGSFTSGAWHNSSQSFGIGESFLFRMSRSRREKSWSVIDQAEMESEIDVFPLKAGHDPNVQMCTPSKVVVGGFERGNRTSRVLADGTVVHQDEWGFGLCLEGNLLYGTSCPCVSFDSPGLSRVHADGSVFEIVNLELWTTTPCRTTTEAEKMELRALFIEEHRIRRD